MTDPFWLELLNGFFFVFHGAFVLFILIAWAPPALRGWHLIAVALTVLSWGFLGIWYGWGYCPCTDWHWQVRIRLGLDITSNSYLHFLVLKLTGMDLPEDIVDAAAVAGLAIALGLNGALRFLGRSTGR
jgi:hypothetical protein